VLPTDIATPMGRGAAQLVAFSVLTLPVTAWFARWEATPSGATPGKRLLGLRVLTTSGNRISLPRSLLRTALKFAIPWELAHTAVWNMLVWPGDPSAAVDMLLLGLANAAIAVDVVMLFVGSRRTPYDRIVGTLVTEARSRRRLEEQPRCPTSPASARHFPARRWMTRSQFRRLPKPPLRKSSGGVPPGVSRVWSWVSAVGMVSCRDMMVEPFVSGPPR
jgi:uncharacterized RDD family membrane protein YckC